ncbi:MAG: Hpt domain-containing protein [Magnetococcales bacterium]|nr:Hpt domain-containing protein [Magnetococcales bacterium]
MESTVNVAGAALHLPVLNFKELELLREDMGGNIDGLIKKFLEKLPVRIDAICAAAESGDLEALVAEAHRLKGGSRSLGADALAEYCSVLERLGKQGDHHQARQYVVPLQESARLLHRELDQLLLHGNE